MKFRLAAFGLHLSGSAAALTLVLGALWLGWYAWPGWYLAGAVHVVGIVVLVDLVLGPTLTLIVANPAKRRAELARDIAVIVAVQLTALVYGGITLWGGRPLYYAFSVDRLQLVQASDLRADDVDAAQRENPALAPSWFSGPRWVWAPLPDNASSSASSTRCHITSAEKRTLKNRMARAGLAADQADAIVLWGGLRRMLAVFDPRTLALRALVAPN